jgi:hypothetical protein
MRSPRRPSRPNAPVLYCKELAVAYMSAAQRVSLAFTGALIAFILYLIVRAIG